jgi:hypothetical protein
MRREKMYTDRVALSERMYELAIAAVKDGMSVADAAEKFMVDQAILACRLYA